jgi:nucleoside-diphosphate-sugar epimerase
MKVFVSGAAGFLGKAVVAELVKRGHEVVGLVRTEAKGKVIENLGGRYLIGDLTKDGSWKDEVQSSYRVVSLSWPIETTEKFNLDRMIELNLLHAKGVSNLIKAAKHGEAKSIFVTYDTLCFGDNADKWVEGAGTIQPAGFCRPIGNAYDEITRAGEDSGIPLVNVFPGRVYGPEGWFTYMIGRIHEGTWKLAGKGDNFLSLIHIGDLAWAYGEAVERLTHNESFSLVDGNPATQAEFTYFVADMLGVPHPETVSVHEFADKEGIMLTESLATSARVSGDLAAKLLDFVPTYTDYHSGILDVLKSIGIMPKAQFKEKAA